ncbi:MAG TPA: hypothetical protein ENF73_00595 [Proteobacteria bacterium]|nr:hypothetical protein [Pseudomonadota bacterium]
MTEKKLISYQFKYDYANGKATVVVRYGLAPDEETEIPFDSLRDAAALTEQLRYEMPWYIDLEKKIIRTNLEPVGEEET